ncbi:MAG: 23S rRNA (guanosine(2251)-2'-O)-methyltransferase RlmB [Rickettsiaceae bacterium H1]|nr:23S rRNA (guanosine(2251)-2'-O)-methyltransferase RlmB [Rickettsiaceae bacterium H1]
MLKKNRYTWICGYHSTISALKNKRRKHKVLLITSNFYNKNKSLLTEFKNIINITEKNKISALFPKNVAHQEIALRTTTILPTSIEDIINNRKTNSVILALDQITDVGNIGAILRSAAAFGIDGVIITQHNSPNKSTIGKTASGALEFVPLIYVNNLVNTIKYAKDHGYWCYGMNEKGKSLLPKVRFEKKAMIIVGSEESGLRKLTEQNCDFIIGIPMSGNISSLNVANATSIALYSIYSQNIKNSTKT